MKIKKIVSFESDQNCYLLYEGKSGVLIDPGADCEKILRECEGIDIKYILLTHCHYDHLESLEDIRKIKNSKVVSSENCRSNMQNENINVSVHFGNPVSFKPSDIVLGDGEILNTDIGDIKCIYTPGHTSCCVCFLKENHLFSGDTLFRINVGRWDLPTADMNELINSIKNKLYKLDDEFLVHPGHGSDTTIAHEKKYNLYVKADK